MPKFKVKRLTSTARLPERTHDTDTGYDLFADRVETTGKLVTVYTGIAIQPEQGFYCEVVPRSSISKKYMSLANSVGVIDYSYRGEIILKFYRHIDEFLATNVEVGEKIAQLIVRWRFDAEWEEVDNLDETARGAGGFGSTGK